MKLVSVDLELLAIKTLTASSEMIRGQLLAMLNSDMFTRGFIIEAFERVQTVARERSHLMSWNELMTDPVLSEKNRKLLKAFKRKALVNQDRVKRMVSQLNEYRQLRKMYRLGTDLVEEITKAEKLNVNDLIEFATDSLTTTRKSFDVESAFLHIGKGSNLKDPLKRVLKGEETLNLPTGINAYDSRSGGFPQSSLIVFAGETGGGKSTLAQQVLTNMTRLGADCCYVPLEMEQSEMIQRQVAQIGDESLNNIIQAKLKLNKERRKQLYLKMMEYDEKARKNDARLSYFNPPEDMSMEELLFLLKPYGYQVICIDYIGLLKGVGGDDQWRALGNAARFAKIFATNNKCIVILCAQLSEDGMIRYSRAVKEHASIMWTWLWDEFAQETGIAEVIPQKSRNQEPFPFHIKMEFDKMRCRDLTEEEKQLLLDDESDPEADSGQKVMRRHSKKAQDNGGGSVRTRGDKGKKKDRYSKPLATVVDESYFDIEAGEE